MQDISKRVCAKFKEARRSLGLTQKALAAEIGCQQPALSMFESGFPTKLSSEYVGKLAERLGIDLKKVKVQAAAEERERVDEPTVSLGFCPERECPSNVAYDVRGRTFYRVTLQKGRYCAHCGEVLEKRCPQCGMPLNDGACCMNCGHPYIG